MGRDINPVVNIKHQEAWALLSISKVQCGVCVHTCPCVCPLGEASVGKSTHLALSIWET